MDDEVLARLLVEWNLLTEGQVAEAKKLQQGLRHAGDNHPLESILTEFDFMDSAALSDIIEAAHNVMESQADFPPGLSRHFEERGRRLGHFILLNEIGRGGLGVVFRAWDTEGRRMVALKLLGGAEINDDSAVELLKEGRRLARLRHPNIRPCYEFGQIQGQYYLSMKLLEGVGLDELIRSSRLRGRLSPLYAEPDRYLGIVRDIALAVEYLHTRKPPIVHCDLKPQNIFTDLDFRAYLVDLGVAQILSDAGAAQAAREIRGTPSYMAPEQILGIPEKIGVRTDVYGIGAVLYELLCGRPPFAGSIKEVMDKNLLVDPPSPSEVVLTATSVSSRVKELPRVPPEMEEVCLRCLAKEPKDRYASAGEVARRIGNLLEGRRLQVQEARVPPPTTHRQPTERLRPKLRRAGMTGFILGTAFAAVLIGVLLLLLRPNKETLETRRRLAETNLEGLASGLQIEAAEEGYHEFADTHPDAAPEDWIAGKLRELKWLRIFRDCLVVVLDRQRPAVEEFHARSGEPWSTRIVAASREALLVKEEGGDLEMAWSQVAPEILFDLADHYLDQFVGQARLGLVLFAAKNGMYQEALRILKSVEDGPDKEFLAALPGLRG